MPAYGYGENPPLTLLCSIKSKEFYILRNILRKGKCVLVNLTEGSLEWVSQDGPAVTGSEVCRHFPKAPIMTQTQAKWVERLCSVSPIKIN